MSIETIECTGYCDQLSCPVCRAELILNGFSGKTIMSDSDDINELLKNNEFHLMSATYLESYAEKVRAFTVMHG